MLTLYCVYNVLCTQKYGEERVQSPERDGRPHKMRKVTVFLNPTANRRSEGGRGRGGGVGGERRGAGGGRGEGGGGGEGEGGGRGVVR